MMNSAEKNIIESVYLLMKLLNLKITKSNIKQKLVDHYDFPSLLSIKDTLQSFCINSVAIKLNFTKLSEIPLPAIAYLEVDKGNFAILTHVNESKVKWQHDEWGKREESIVDFCTKWNGVLLLVEPEDRIKEPFFLFKKIFEKINESIGMICFLGGLIVLLTAILKILTFYSWEINKIAALCINFINGFLGIILLSKKNKVFYFIKEPQTKNNKR